MNNMVSTREAARILNVSNESVTQQCRAGKLRAKKVPYAGRYGHRWMIDAARLNARGNGKAALVDSVASIEMRLGRIEAALFGAAEA